MLRNFHLEKAKQMLHETIKWRKEFGLENIHSTWKKNIEFENETGKTYLRGYDNDNEGHVI